VHVTALHYALLAVVSAALTAVFLPAFVQGAGAEALEQLGGATLPTLAGQFLGFIVLAFAGVGLFVRRGFGESLDRLGVTRRFSGRLWLAATAIGLASAWLVQLTWATVAPENLAEVERISEVLFRPLLELGFLGAVLAGIVPAISEELVFRGAAQPRFGLLLTALLFMVVHTQYTISPALGQILVMGLLLGVVRERANTTTAIAVHATYNFLVVFLGF
jgi:membrane protease YdiL (CAAX protease family)